MIKLRQSFVVLMLLLATFQASSKGFAPVATPQPGGFKFKFASNGQPVANYAPIAGGAMGASGVAGMTIAPGIFVEAAATGAITGFAAGGAWAAAIGALGAVAIAGIPAVKAWMDSAGVQVTNGGGLGALPVGADNFDYSANGQYTWQSTAMGACQALVDSMNNPSGGVWFKRVARSYVYDGYGAAGICKGDVLIQNSTDTSGNAYNVKLGDTERRAKQLPVNPVPVTVEQARASMSAVFPPAAALQALLDRDFPAPVSDIQIVAPTAKYIGNTVILGVDGSTISETTTGVFTSFGDNLYIDLRKDFKKVFPGGLSTDTKQVTTTNPDGTTSTQIVTTTTTTPEKSVTGTYATPRPDAEFAIDSALPPVPKLYEPVYPRGIAGVWSDKKAQLTSAPLTGLMSSLMPAVASVGSCPSMPINLNFTAWANFGTKDVAPPCYIWDWGKAIIILSALLLARGLIFGG